MKAGRSIEAWRKLDDFLVRSQRLPKGIEVSALSVDGLRAEWVRGVGAETSRVILYFHGGGFIIGSPATHRELASRISLAAGVPVLSLAFRLAPEHPFPAAMEDAKAAYRWLLTQGYTPAQVIIGGDSTGGGLALKTLLSLEEEGTPLPAAAFFLSPMTDWVDFDGESYSSRARLDPMVSVSQSQFSASLYVGENSKDTPLLRPARMDLAGLPPLWIQAGDHEVLLSDSERLAHRARGAGVAVDLKVWPGMWHVFQAAASLVPEARQSLDELGKFVRDNLENGKAP